MKSKVMILYHKEADQATVDRLALANASTLMAGVDVNRAATGSGKAIMLKEGYYLSCADKARAKDEGVDTDADYIILGVPEGSELADYIRKHTKDCPRIDI